MNGSKFTRNVSYPIKAFVAEASGRDYIRIQHKNGNSSFNSSWSGMLQNLEPGNVLFISYPSKIVTIANTRL